MKKLMLVLSIIVLSYPSFADYQYITSGFFGTKTIEGYDHLIMTGGERLTAKDYSILDIQNTSPLVVLSGGLWDLIVADNSRLIFSGGHVNRLDIGDYATTTISGGQINKLASGYYPSTRAWINIICQTYNYNSTTKILTGTWADSSAFNTQLIDIDGHVSTYSVMKFTIIPEPATMLLLGLGGLLLRRKKS